MKEIIAPIERGKIMAELTPERFLRHTNKGGNEIYVVNYKNAPYTMQEIGRLRKSHSGRPAEEPEKRSTSICSTRWKNPVNSSSYGIPMQKRYWAAIVSYWERTCNIDKEGRPIIAISAHCSTSLRNSFGNICRTPSNWAGHSFLSNTNRPEPEQKVFSPSIICGTD